MRGEPFACLHQDGGMPERRTIALHFSLWNNESDWSNVDVDVLESFPEGYKLEAAGLGAREVLNVREFTAA